MRIVIITILFFSNQLFCQISNYFDEGRIINWSKSGMQTTPPPIEVTYTANTVSDLIDILETKDPSVMVLIELSGTTYNFINQQLEIPSNTIIRGIGSSTILNFDFTGAGTKECFLIDGGGNIAETAISDQELLKGQIDIEVPDISALTAGDYIELLFESDDIHTHSSSNSDPIDTTNGFLGQVNRIDEINGNIMTMADGLNMDFTSFANQGTIYKNNGYKQNIGIEDLKITYDYNVSNNVIGILFNHAANCWVSGIESDSPFYYHVKVARSSEIEITGSYFHHSIAYQGGQAYGVLVEWRSTNVLVENNIFEHLRHSMIVARGASGNVFGYNYSFDQFSHDNSYNENYLGDINVHGHFPFANLFEGNICEFIQIDDFWGFAGPNNTFFRNRSLQRVNQVQNHGYQLNWDKIDQSFYNLGYGQNVVGNWFDYQNNDGQGISYIGLNGNPPANEIEEYNIQHNVDSGDQTGNINSTEIGISLYHTNRPSFNTNDWPFDPNNYQSLSAYSRYQSGDFTYNRNRYIDLTNKSVNSNDNLGGSLNLSIENSIIDYNQVSSGNKIQIPNRDVSVNARTNNEILQEQKHLRWDDNSNRFKLINLDYEIPLNKIEIIANFDYQLSVIINSNLQNNTQLQIHDPWFVRENGTQTGNDWLDLNGQYSVFLNQQSTQQNPNAPEYSLDAPLYVGQVNGIFQFTHWSGNDVLFDGNSTSNESLTNVVFLSSEAHVTANYDLNNPLNLQPGALVIPPDETLIIYADSDIPFESTTSYVDNPIDPMYIESEGFRLYVQGKLIVENNATLKKSGNGKWGGIVLEPDGILEMNGALVEDAFIGIIIPDPGDNFLDTIYSKIERCVFKDNSISLLYINNSNCGYSHPTIEINNNTFYNNGFTVFTHSFADPDECDIPKPSSNLKILMNNNIIANSQMIYSLIDTMNYTFFFNTPVSDEIEALGEGNVENGTNPLFIDPQNGDYHLTYSSPCRDAGHPDLDGDGVMWQNDPDDQDPDGTRMDMGAFYYELPNTYLSFHPQMSVGENPRLIWTPINVGEEIYYDIYYHIANSSSLIYLATTQSMTYTDLRYIVTEIEQATNEKRVKVKKNQQNPPEQATVGVYYTIVVRDGDGNMSPPSNEIMARVIRAPNPKEMVELLPEKYDLTQGYPNPFNPTLTLPYALPDLSTVVIHVYDINGRRINTLKNGMQVAGYHKIRWDGKNKSDKPLSSGMYIIQMSAKSMESGELFTKAQKIVLLK